MVRPSSDPRAGALSHMQALAYLSSGLMPMPLLSG
jgi:hypothetical protein